MNDKSYLLDHIAQSAGLTKKAAGYALMAFVEAIHRSIRVGEAVKVPGLGKFEVVDRAAREGVSPLTGDPYTYPARKAVKFKAAQALKDQVANPK